MADVEFHIDRAKLEKLAFNSESTAKLVNDVASQMASRANALGAGYRTPKWHDHVTGETKGGKQPEYESTPKKTRKGARAVVHPANYAAMKDNMEHNTLLKALR